MARNRTELRHISQQGNVVRVTEEDGNYYIGNTNERAEGKMAHYKAISRNQGISNIQGQRPAHAINNPYYGSGHGEWDDYAHTSDDL